MPSALDFLFEIFFHKLSWEIFIAFDKRRMRCENRRGPDHCAGFRKRKLLLEHQLLEAAENQKCGMAFIEMIHLWLYTKKRKRT